MVGIVIDPATDPHVRALAADVAALPTFPEATAAVLATLSAAYGGLWVAAQTAGDDWVTLATSGEGYPVAAGDVFPWSDTLCARMATGEGPRVAPRAMDVPAYAAAPMAQQLKLGHYVGAPLVGPDGELFGTLCGIGPEPAPDTLRDAQPFFELQARLLSSLLRVELLAEAETRRADLAEQHARVDALTGIMNRRGWDAMLVSEEQRCRRYAHPAAVVVLDVDGLKRRNDHDGHAAGDRLLAEVGRVLRSICRASDVVARTGGDEFAVLCVETTSTNAQIFATRLQQLLHTVGVSASFGVAGLDPREGDLRDAWRRADEAMYSDKGGTSGERQAALATVS